MYHVGRINLSEAEHVLNLQNAPDQALHKCNRKFQCHKDKTYSHPEQESLTEWPDKDDPKMDSSQDKPV